MEVGWDSCELSFLLVCSFWEDEEEEEEKGQQTKPKGRTTLQREDALSLQFAWLPYLFIQVTATLFVVKIPQANLVDKIAYTALPKIFPKIESDNRLFEPPPAL